MLRLKCITSESVLMYGTDWEMIVREGKTSQITSAIQTGVREGMIDMDTSIRQLLEAGKISGQAAYDKAIDKEQFKDMLGS